MSHRAVRRLAVACASAAAVLLGTVASSSAGTADPILWKSAPAYHLDAGASTYALFPGGGGIGQRFTATASGIAGHFTFSTTGVADPTTLWVSITADLSAWPAPTALLASEPIASVDPATGLATVDFTADDVTLTSGTEYLVTVENLGTDVVQVLLATGGHPGYAYFVPGTGAVWADSGLTDNLAGNLDADVYDSDAPGFEVSEVVPKTPNGAHGWYRKTPSVLFTCFDNTSGISNCPAPLRVPNGNHRRSPITLQISDLVGHVTRLDVTLKVDTIKPRLRITGVKPRRTYAHPPSVGCHAADTVSGLNRGCIVRIVKVNKHKRVARARASDIAGNVTHRRVTYFVK
jgi:hypothetical protein